MPESVVIVKWAEGFVAHVRYENPIHNIDISHSVKNLLYRAIDRHVYSIKNGEKK